MNKATKICTEAFNTAAAFDFVAAVREAYEMFPDARENVFFADLCDRKLFHPDTRRAKQATERLNANPYAFEMIQRFDVLDRTSCCWHFAQNQYLILLYTRDDRPYVLGRDTPHIQNIYAHLDHEIGHAVIQGGMGGDCRTFRESIATSHEILRHWQRFGTNSAAAEGQAARSAFNAVFREESKGIIHFVSPVLEKIAEQKHTLNLSAMTPQETCRVARQFTLAYMPHSHDLEALAKSFAPFNGTLDGTEAPLRRLAEAVLSADQPGFFKWGASALGAAFNNILDPRYEGRTKRTGMGVPAEPLLGAYWDDVKQRLAERQEDFDRQGPANQNQGPDKMVLKQKSGRRP